MTSRSPRPPGPPPDEAALHEAGVAYLARYAASQTGVMRVLERIVDRWAQRARRDGVEAELASAQAAAAREAVRAVAARLAEIGAVNDAAFAATRARNLLLAGRPHRAVFAHLAAKGVHGETIQAALAAAGVDELTVALVFARRRRIGPFRAKEIGHQRELAMLCRAGFSQEIARRALHTSRAEAEVALDALRGT
jgi:regulatory protein